MTHLCLPNIIRDLLPCRILELLHIIWLPQKKIDAIVFLLPFLCPTINSHVYYFSAVVSFSVEAGFSVIVVVSVAIFFINVYPSILISVAIFSILVTFSIEELTVLAVPFIFSYV